MTRIEAEAYVKKHGMDIGRRARSGDAGALKLVLRHTRHLSKPRDQEALRLFIAEVERFAETEKRK